MTAVTEPPGVVLYPSLHGLRKRTKTELIALIENMAEDWRKLNAIHNHTAEQRDWCSEYEERQERHNDQFAVLKLMGRSSAVGMRPSGL